MDGRAWTAASARTPARRLQRQRWQERGQTRAAALACRARGPREALAAHWALGDRLGGPAPCFGDAVAMGRLLGCPAEALAEAQEHQPGTGPGQRGRRCAEGRDPSPRCGTACCPTRKPFGEQAAAAAAPSLAAPLGEQEPLGEQAAAAAAPDLAEPLGEQAAAPPLYPAEPLGEQAAAAAPDFAEPLGEQAAVAAAAPYLAEPLGEQAAAAATPYLAEPLGEQAAGAPPYLAEPFGEHFFHWAQFLDRASHDALAATSTVQYDAVEELRLCAIDRVRDNHAAGRDVDMDG
ncbi:unnamed protein product [Prorocentrum cordatum]|uniref:Phospholipase B-like n=1 Tax=Prorocentrum cordatum TaxID=2364126 RepID=A0ABN9UXV8_9DINO|nr:unnamed protein product [Polarella glacialis]